MFSDDFVNDSESKERLQRLIDVVYCKQVETKGDINLSTRRLLFLSVVRPSIEYIWKGDLGG